MSATPDGHTAAERPNGDGVGHRAERESRGSTDAVRDMVREDQRGHARSETHSHPAGSTASADAVESVRRSLNDLKHDVRMLKVGLDKQGAAIDRVLGAIEARDEEQREEE